MTITRILPNETIDRPMDYEALTFERWVFSRICGRFWALTAPDGKILEAWRAFDSHQRSGP